MSVQGLPSMQFVCRQCRYALRKQIIPVRRQFSSTPSRDSRALPTFAPTSSPELDTLLTSIRQKYFLPLYLNPAQKKLIRSDKLKSQLEHDPVFATLGDEEVRLEHIDFTKDMPPRRAFLDVIDLMKGKSDWSNLPGLLEGYHNSKVKLSEWWLRVMIDKAREQGAMSVVVKCLEQVERNGFSLSMPAVREGVLLGLRQIAKEAEWDVDKTKTLKRAEIVIRHMEHPDHCGSRKVTEQDPRAEPYVIAVPLELAVWHTMKTAVDHGKVELYSTRLISALAQQKSALNETEPWQIADGLGGFHLMTAFERLNMTVTKFIPVHNALKLSQQVRGNDWPEEERAFAAHLQKQIEQKLDLATEEAKKMAKYPDVKVEMPAVEEWKATKAS